MSYIYIKKNYFVGDITSKQNLRSASYAGLTEQILKSSSIIVNKSSPTKKKKEYN